MKMANTLGVVCGLVLASAITGCANENSARASAPSNAAVASSAQQAAAPASDDMWIGPTRAESTDPTVLAWQTDLLTAMGRDGEYYLFDYVISAKGQVYVGIKFAPLGLTPEQMAAAEAVNAKYAKTSAGSFEKGNLWLATQRDSADGHVADSR